MASNRGKTEDMWSSIVSSLTDKDMFESDRNIGLLELLKHVNVCLGHS
jgi:hypothetical protein